MLNSVDENTPPLGTQVLCVVSICCVGFASLDVVCDELHDCVWNAGLYQLSVSVCMFIVPKSLLISSATVIVHAGEPFG